MKFTVDVLELCVALGALNHFVLAAEEEPEPEEEEEKDEELV